MLTITQLDWIGDDLKNPKTQTWVPNSLSLVQAVVCPLISSASDTFQARKLLLVVSSLISFIGAAIAPGSQSIYRLIVAQTLIGFGFAAVPLAYCVPSEILPRRWRPSKFEPQTGKLSQADVTTRQWLKLPSMLRLSSVLALDRS